MKYLKRIKFALPPLLTAVVLCIIYAKKHIYPFGNLTIDYYDFGQQIAAFYYHVYDSLHGAKNLFFDPFTALSTNMAMGTSGCSNISIFNLFFLFVKRDALLESFSYYLIIKMALMSLTMYITLNKSFKIPYFMRVALSLSYAFSGFVMMHYITIQWLDLAILFPLLILFTEKLLKTGSQKGYILVLFLCLTSSYYLTFMMLIFIILMAGLRITVSRLFEKENLKLTQLLLGTVTAFLLSAFIVVPQLVQTLTSVRFSNGNEGRSGILSAYIDIINHYEPAYTMRWFSLLSLSLCFALIITGIVKFRKDKKYIVTVCASVIIMVSELFIESVNLFWHFGSYVDYPIRNGFIINFTFVYLAALTAEMLYKEENNQPVVNKKNALGLMAAVILCTAVFELVTGFLVKTGPFSIRKMFYITVLLITVLCIICYCFINMFKGKLRPLLLFLILAEIGINSFIFIGKPELIKDYAVDKEQSGEYIRISNQLREAFNISVDDDISLLNSRIKNPDESLNANYGFVLRRPALSNWTHVISPELQEMSEDFSYSIQYTRLLDSGGTVFSDALLGISNVISLVPQDEKLYELIDEKDIEINHITGETKRYYYYECKYKLPFSKLANDITPLEEEINNKNRDVVSLHNAFYKVLSGKDKISDYIFDKTDYNKIKEEGNSLILNENFDVKGRKALYLRTFQFDNDDYNTLITVNNKTVLIPSIEEYDNEYYPAHFNNNGVYLGSFENETVNIKIVFDKDKVSEDTEFKPLIYYVDLEAFEELIDYQNEAHNRTVSKEEAAFDGYRMNVNASDGYLLIPVAYDKGFNVYYGSNSNRLDFINLQMFSAVKLKEAGVINIKFSPEGMKTGVYLSIFGLLLFILIFLEGTGKKIENISIPYIETICFYGYFGIIIVMYIIPVFYGVLKWLI